MLVVSLNELFQVVARSYFQEAKFTKKSPGLGKAWWVCTKSPDCELSETKAKGDRSTRFPRKASHPL